MKLLEILQKELDEFPKDMVYAVQDVDGEVKFGKHSRLPLRSGGIWQRHDGGKCPLLHGVELAEDWDSAIVTKDMWEKHRVKQIIVNVSGLTAEEKQQTNEALAKITGFNKMTDNLVMANWMYAPSSYICDQIAYSNESEPNANKESTHTPQQVLEMAGMAKQGHVHAESMAQYAEDALTHPEPWKLWQIKVNFTDGHKWVSPSSGFHFDANCEYRRKPKTHIVHGVEVPDLRIDPKVGEKYYLADPTEPKFTHKYTSTKDSCDTVWTSRRLCYEPTEEGKQAAILHAKAWLGIA